MIALPRFLMLGSTTFSTTRLPEIALNRLLHIDFASHGQRQHHWTCNRRGLSGASLAKDKLQAVY